VQTWSLARLRRERRRLRADIRALRRTGGAPDVPVPAVLQSIAACESGGNPRAIGGGGGVPRQVPVRLRHVGARRRQRRPAAAPEAEQDRRAALALRARGRVALAVCGR
jgi:hypothetical protein